jgi:hypothetical protein
MACPSLPAVPRMPAPLPAAAVPSRQPHHALPLSYTDVYVDDFCNLVQGNARRRRIARRILFHAIDEVIGCWGTSKVILGWLIDTVKQTLELPPHRYERLCATFDDLQGRKRVSLTTWQQVLGAWRWLSRAVVAFSALFKPASSIPTVVGNVQTATRMVVSSILVRADDTVGRSLLYGLLTRLFKRSHLSLFQHERKRRKRK